MTKIPAATVTRWEATCRNWLADTMNLRIEAITLGRDAWTVAHRAGITEEAYRDRSVLDAHIQTALERIFPNATFGDRKCC